jgi:5'-nucleotidase
MMKSGKWLGLAGWLFLAGCSASRPSGGDDGRILVTFVQVNDVYEIAPLSGGKEGGLARVATLKQAEKQRNANTFLLMAGDFLSPSVYNSLQYEGKAIRGRQMVETLNAAGLDFAVFGNHEFDIRESELQERIEESRFQWIASNVFHRTRDEILPFARKGQRFPDKYVLSVRDADGTTARIGIIALTLPFNRADYVSYTDAIPTATRLYNELKDSVDAVIAFTHQSMEDDRQLAAALPGLALILGGHEHDQRFERYGKGFISKAHANAKSAYVVDLLINKKKKRARSSSRLVTITDAMPSDAATDSVVQKWTSIAERNYSSLGFDARRVVRASGEPLDGREGPVRRQPTNLTRLIVKAMEAAAPQAQLAIVNAGSIRVDDLLPSPVTEYDIIRTLPFGGGVREVEMKGSLLLRVLEAGRGNVGSGGFLHYSEKLGRGAEGWMLGGAPIQPEGVYRVALSEFLLSGKEANLDFLNPSNALVVKAFPAPVRGDLLFDIRLTLIRYLLQEASLK